MPTTQSETSLAPTLLTSFSASELPGHSLQLFIGSEAIRKLHSITAAKNEKISRFQVEPGSLGFSVMLFCLEAFACIAVIILRRRPSVGGELGGPMCMRVSKKVYP